MSAYPIGKKYIASITSLKYSFFLDSRFIKPICFSSIPFSIKYLCYISIDRQDFPQHLIPVITLIISLYL